MKKVLFGFVVLTLIFATSCKKSSSSSNSWSFKGNTYNTYLATASGGDLAATCVSSNNTINGGTCDVYFYNGTAPTSGSSYTVVATPTSANQVSITLLTGIGAGSSTYYSTGTGSTALSVSVASNGHITASGSGIMMSSGSDSSTLSLSITQTQ